MEAVLIFPLLFPFSAAFSVNDGDFWTVVQNTSAYQSLDICSRDCIIKVNGSLADGDTPCVAYGCVCTDSTNGKNYIQGLANVKDCAIQSQCSDPNQATTGFADICAIYAAGIAQPVVQTDTTILEITRPGYDNLTNCAKWCLNGCRDANGTQNEPNCGTIYYPPNWGDYRGLAADQDCTTVDCLCSNANFDSAVAKLIESSREYCGMPVSTPQAPYPPYDDMQDVLVNYCLRMGYPHHNYTAVLVGAAPTGNSSMNATGASSSVTSSPSNVPTKHNSWSPQDIVTAIVATLSFLFGFATFVLELVKYMSER